MRICNILVCGCVCVSVCACVCVRTCLCVYSPLPACLTSSQPLCVFPQQDQTLRFRLPQNHRKGQFRKGEFSRNHIAEASTSLYSRCDDVTGSICWQHLLSNPLTFCPGSARQAQGVDQLLCCQGAAEEDHHEEEGGESLSLSPCPSSFKHPGSPQACRNIHTYTTEGECITS